MRILPIPLIRSAARTGLLRICVATFFWALAFGVHSQAASHWLSAVGASNTAIGWNHAGYYLGLAVGSVLMPRALGLWGMRCAMVGMGVSALAQICFPLAGNLTGWFLLRLVGGVAGAWSIIPLETWISGNAPAGQRTRHFARFGLALTLGGAIGIGGGLSLYESGSLLPFLIGGTMPIVGLAALLGLGRGTLGATHEPEARSIPWRMKLFSLGTGWYQGFLEGGMLAFLTLFLMSIGYRQEGAGWLMATTLFGVIAFQPPLAWLADRAGARVVLLGCYAVVFAGLLLAPWRTGAVELGVILFLVGASSGAMYPLGLALLGEGLSEKQTPRAYSWYLALECLGSQFGAAAMGMARDAQGDGAMFGVAALAGMGVLGLVGAARLWRRGQPAASDMSAKEAA